MADREYDYTVGIVPSLDVRPLTEGLTEPDRNIRIVEATPPELERMMADGELDGGLLPIGLHYTLKNIVSIPNICIAGKTGFDSVIMITKGRIEKIRKIAIQPRDNVAGALCRILLVERFRQSAEIVDYEYRKDLDFLSHEADAFVLDGDEALNFSDDRFGRLDLCGEWHALTRLPFVFYMWAIKNAPETLPLSEEIQYAKKIGMVKIGDIAKRHAVDRMDEHRIFEHLTKKVHYSIDKHEAAGINLFYRYAVKCGIMQSKQDIVFIKRDDKLEKQ